MRTTITYAAKLVLITTLCGLWLFAAAGQVEACSCGSRPSPSGAYHSSTVVFSGKVVAIRGFDIPAWGTYSSADRGTIEFRVSTVWKGPAYETMSVTTLRDSASCGYPFEEGREYVVYAYAHGFLEGPPTVRQLLQPNAELRSGAGRPKVVRRRTNFTVWDGRSTASLDDPHTHARANCHSDTHAHARAHRHADTHAHIRTHCHADSSTCHRRLQHPLAVRPRTQRRLGPGTDRRGRPARLAQAPTAVEARPVTAACSGSSGSACRCLPSSTRRPDRWSCSEHWPPTASSCGAWSG